MFNLSNHIWCLIILNLSFAHYLKIMCKLLDVWYDVRIELSYMDNLINSTYIIIEICLCMYTLRSVVTDMFFHHSSILVSVRMCLALR